ncbi:hypothetical protein Tco_0983176 [Tanacetum coccineum]
MDVEGAKSDEDATYVEDQGNEAVKDTNANLEGRDDVMTDVILPQVQATQEIEDTHVTLTPVNPDGQQQSSSVSSGFVSNMLNPNQDTGVDAIFGQHAEATSLIDTRTVVVDIFWISILKPISKMKAFIDNFSELHDKQNNMLKRYLHSRIVDQYLANKMQEAVVVAVQLKYDRIREESNTANQQFLDSIDEGMKKIIKEQVKKEVSKITPKIEKLVIDQLESEVLVRSSKEANTSHAVSMATLSALKCQTFKAALLALVDAYGTADKSLSRYIWRYVTLKSPRGHCRDDQNPPLDLTVVKRRRSGKEPIQPGATSTCITSEFETGVHERTSKKKRSNFFLLVSNNLHDLPSPDLAWNKSYKATTKKWTGSNPEVANILMICDSHYVCSKCKGRHGIPFHYFINNDLDYLRGGDVKHARDDDVLLQSSKKETSRLRIHRIEDMLLLSRARKSDNLIVEERIAFNVALVCSQEALFFRRRVEDLQLGVVSYQKKKTQYLTKACGPRYRSNLRRQDAYMPYSDPRGFIYENKDKKNRLMRIDELDKFSDGTLDDVRTALNDLLKGL